MPTIGDLISIRQSLGDGFTISASSIAGDDRYRRMLGEPCPRRVQRAIR